MDCKRVFLSEKEIPTAWYNLQADLPKPVPPPLHPGTKQPLAPADLEPIFAKALIAQEVSRERWIEIPEAGAEGVRDLAAQSVGAGDEPGEGPEDARPASTSRTRATARRAAISRIRPCRRPTTTRSRASTT